MVKWVVGEQRVCWPGRPEPGELFYDVANRSVVPLGSAEPGGFVIRSEGRVLSSQYEKRKVEYVATRLQRDPRSLLLVPVLTWIMTNGEKAINHL